MTYRVGIVGDPVDHSRSPSMQNAAFAATGIDAHYVLWPTPLAALAARVASLRAADMLGANVTIPHKQAVIPLVDVLADSALAVGAINTIVNEGGRLVGHNTDADGLIDALRAQGYARFEHGVILGAGGAARAALVALTQLGAETLHIAARDPAKAMALLAEHVPWNVYPIVTVGHLPSSASDSDDAQFIATLRDADIIINATPIGMAKSSVPDAPAWVSVLKAEAVVVDLVTTTTPLLLAANTRGLVTMDGLPMLLHQGARAFTLWTKLRAPLAIMRAALNP